MEAGGITLYRSDGRLVLDLGVAGTAYVDRAEDVLALAAYLRAMGEKMLSEEKRRARFR